MSPRAVGGRAKRSAFRKWLLLPVFLLPLVLRLGGLYVVSTSLAVSLRPTVVEKQHPGTAMGRVPFDPTNVTACNGKAKYVDMLLSGGMRYDMTEKDCSELPTEQQVADLYGNVVIHGLDTCQAYRDILTAAAVKPTVRVAGLYNSGTTAFQWALNTNVENLGKWGYDPRRWRVPWGKHARPVHKWNNTNYSVLRPRSEFMMSRDHIMPVVLVRDPFRWMQSMTATHQQCHAPYAANWTQPSKRCPTLVFNDIDRSILARMPASEQPTANTSVVTVDSMHKHKTQNYNAAVERFSSLAGMWSVWYREYFDADYPRLFVRFEDAMFRPDEVMAQVTRCVGLPVPDPFKHQVKDSKPHGNAFTIVSAMSKYGNKSSRFDEFDKLDLDYARSVLDSELMREFQY